MTKLKDERADNPERAQHADPHETLATSEEMNPHPEQPPRADFSGPQRRLPPSTSGQLAARRAAAPAASTMRGAPLPTLLSQQHLEPHLHPLASFDGFIAAVLVERYLGQPVCILNPDKHELEPLASLAARSLNLHLDLLHLHDPEDNLLDVLITSGQRFLLFRPLQHNPSLFLLLLLQRDRANLGMARIRLAEVEARLRP